MSEPRAPRWMVMARVVYALQLISVALIWVFVLSISAWILHLNQLSRELDDVPSASVAISIVAIPVFLTGAGVLTYVYLGLRRGALEGPSEGTEGDAAAAPQGARSQS